MAAASAYRTAFAARLFDNRISRFVALLVPIAVVEFGTLYGADLLADGAPRWRKPSGPRAPWPVPRRASRPTRSLCT